ncbi:MAG: NAD(P)-binding domain-containing protein [Deltaproteobacteria bacterium]|nr:NAD(P)-binding domain-containing protein [Deltaproteobacteria bacterium]
MQIAILGTGMVGKTLAAKLASLGHVVTMGTRDPDATRERDGMAAWLAENRGVTLLSFATAAAGAEQVWNATGGKISLEVLHQCGAENLAGKVLVDIANPLDFSAGFPPTLSVCNHDSLGEQVQRAFPAARVVKTLNTVNATLMVEPQTLAGGAHTMFVCGDDEGAKAAVTAVLQSFGWSDVLDLGGIGQARGMEMLLPLWVRLYGKFGSPAFSFAVVR